MNTKNKLKSLKQLKVIVSRLKQKRKKVVFTNGCFDILHLGHVTYLQAARKKGDVLVIGLNSDRSVKKIKGKKRPLLPQSDRIGIISALQCVDYVVLFNDETPLRLIEALKPDILIKGADWKAQQIVGSEIVRSQGGTVQTIPIVKGRSTTDIIKIILRKYGTKESR
ncbi:D-glycero-beta-D-manno-heptose 1-phosphate adenylyltransferase [Candidatus Omnitrophota bacterium]